MATTTAAPDLARLRERARLLEEQRRLTLAELDASRAARVSALIAGDPVPAAPARDLEGELEELERAVDVLHDQLAEAEQEAAADLVQERKEVATRKVAEADTAARELRAWLRSSEMQDRLGRVREAIGEAAAAEHAIGTQAGSTQASMTLFRSGLARVVGELEQFLTHDPLVDEERRRAALASWPAAPQPRESDLILLPPGPGSA